MEKREELLYRCVRNKFAQNAELKKHLLATETRELIYASPTDQVYGVGLAVEDQSILLRKNWKGTNLLGKVLMRVRNDLKE